MPRHQRPVIVINQYAIPRNRGGGTRHIDLFGRLDKWRPTIIASAYSHSDHENIRTDDTQFVLLSGVKYAGNGPARVLGWVQFTAKAFFAGLRRPASVVYGSTPQLLAPYAAWALATVKRVPFVLEVRDLWPESIVAAGSLREGTTVHRILVGLERFLYQRAARIVVVTDGWQDHMRSLGIDPAKMVVVPNGTELADFEVAEARDELRREYGIDGYTAIFAGSHGKKDGIDLIVEAAREVPDVHFLLIGGGPMKEPMRERARELGLTNIEFRDAIPKNELPRLLKACDLGLHVVSPLPVFDKGMSPNKLFDYLAAGLPVVSNAKYPLRNVISDDQVGVVVAPDELAAGIERARQADDATKQRWQQHATDLMTSTYSRSAAAATLEDVLDTVVSQRRARLSRTPSLGQRVSGQVASAGASLRSLVRRARTPK